ncbi:ABC-type glycerol-3-phosphate transport system substrate-binding protein [Bradyrhizobium japonicum]
MAVRHKAIAVLIAAAAACLTATGASRAEEITLYSTREAALVEPVVAAFTEASGVKVKIVFVEESWPRLFGQRPAGFKWIPAGLC